MQSVVSIPVRRSWRLCGDQTSAGFQIKDKTKCRIAIEVVSVQSLCAQEAQSFIELQGGDIVDFRLEDDLDK